MVFSSRLIKNSRNPAMINSTTILSTDNAASWNKNAIILDKAAKLSRAIGV